MTPADIERRLTAFMDQQDGEAFAWGVSDCALFCADWWRFARGVDPAASWRGRYASALGAARLIRRAGGYPALFTSGLGRPGQDEGVPMPGAVGLLRAETPVVFGGLIGGVCLGGGLWASRADTGLLIGRAVFDKFWNLE